MSLVVSHYNTQWTLSGTPTVTLFCDGSKCVTPCNLESVTPNNNSTWNMSFTGNLADQGPNSGTMLLTLPIVTQALLTDNKYSVGLPHIGTYYSTTVDLSRPANQPAALPTGNTIVSSTGQTHNGTTVRSFINEITCLTILSTTPPANSFRPGIFGYAKTVIHNEADLNYSVLPNLASVAGCPDAAYVNLRCPLGLPWFDFEKGEPNTRYVASNNAATGDTGIAYPNSDSCYGREISTKWGVIALWLCVRHHANDATNNAIKRQAVVYSVQCGLDIYSFLKNGGRYDSDGGQTLGRVFPAIFAAVMLDDTEMLDFFAANAPALFSETQQTFFITSDDVTRTAAYPFPYLTEDITVPPKAEYGIKHYNQPQFDSRSLTNPPYRLNYASVIPCILALRLMGATGAINHPALMAYVERHFRTVGPLTDSSPFPFATNMWNAYYDSAVVQIPSHAVSGTVGSPLAFTLDSSRTVTLTGVGVTTSIRYTIGTSPADPTADTGTLYTAPFSTGTTNCVIKWRAFRTGADPSAVGSITVNFVTSGHPSAPVNIDVS